MLRSKSRIYHEEKAVFSIKYSLRILLKAQTINIKFTFSVTISKSIPSNFCRDRTLLFNWTFVSGKPGGMQARPLSSLSSLPVRRQEPSESSKDIGPKRPQSNSHRLGPGADKERRQGRRAGQTKGVETRDHAVEAGDKGGLLRKPIRASRQSLLPRAAGRWHSLPVSLFLSVPGVLTGVRQRAAAAAGDTLKSHEICRPALSPRSLHTSGWESYIRVGKKLTRPS